MKIFFEGKKELEIIVLSSRSWLESVSTAKRARNNENHLERCLRHLHKDSREGEREWVFLSEDENRNIRNYKEEAEDGRGWRSTVSKPSRTNRLIARNYLVEWVPSRRISWNFLSVPLYLATRSDTDISPLFNRPQWRMARNTGRTLSLSLSVNLSCACVSNKNNNGTIYRRVIRRFIVTRCPDRFRAWLLSNVVSFTTYNYDIIHTLLISILSRMPPVCSRLLLAAEF